MFDLGDFSVLLLAYVLFGACLALAMFVLLPMIERGALDRVYPAGVRDRARRNASSTLDVIEIDMPGGRLRTVLIMSLAWPYVVWGSR